MEKYRGIEYIVFYFDKIGHFNGYVRIPDNHPYNKLVDKEKKNNLQYILLKLKNAKKTSYGFNDLIQQLTTYFKRSNWTTFKNGYDYMDISCHGGLTFSRRVTKKNKGTFPQGFNEGAWIGWDYAHAGDKIAWPKEVLAIQKKIKRDWQEKYPGYQEPIDKDWTKEEVEIECKNVINQLLEIA